MYRYIICTLLPMHSVCIYIHIHTYTLALGLETESTRDVCQQNDQGAVSKFGPEAQAFDAEHA